MTSLQKPHFLLFSESSHGGRQVNWSKSGGRWRFQLESVDGSATFGATDDEEGLTARRLELLAVVRGLEALEQPSRVTLLTSSRYVSHGIRFGLGSWRDSDWRWEHFGRMTSVANADLWKRIDQALAIHQVRCRTWRLDTADCSVHGASGARHVAARAEGSRRPPFGERLWWMLGRVLSSWRALRLPSRPRDPMLCPQ